MITGNMHRLKLFPYLTNNTAILSWTKDFAPSHLVLSTRHRKRSAWRKQITVDSSISLPRYIAGGNNLKGTKINGAILQQLFDVSMWVLLAVLKFTGFCKCNEIFFFFFFPWTLQLCINCILHHITHLSFAACACLGSSRPTWSFLERCT